MKFKKTVQNGFTHWNALHGPSCWREGLQGFRLPCITHLPNGFTRTPTDRPYLVGDSSGFWYSTLAEAKSAVRDEARRTGII